MWWGHRDCSMPRVLGTTQYVQRSLQPWITFTQAVTSESRRATACIGIQLTAAAAAQHRQTSRIWIDTQQMREVWMNISAAYPRRGAFSQGSLRVIGLTSHVFKQLCGLSGHHLGALVHPFQQRCNPAQEQASAAAGAGSQQSLPSKRLVGVLGLHARSRYAPQPLQAGWRMPANVGMLGPMTRSSSGTHRLWKFPLFLGLVNA